MIFLIKGMSRNAMVSCEAYKRNHQYFFTTLSIDLKGGFFEGKKMEPEHLFIAGSEDVVLFKELSDILGVTAASGRKESEIPDADEPLVDDYEDKK